MAMTKNMITIHVRAFAAAAEALGCREDECTLPLDATVQDAWALLMDAAPKLGDLDGTIAFAIDDRLVNRDTTLQNGHTLALLPPVSGG